MSAWQVIGRVDGREVSVWNTAAAGRPSIERARSSVDEALAALVAYAERQAHREEAS